MRAVWPGEADAAVGAPQRLIVIGFMGGRVGAGNLVHREARLAKDLQERFPLELRAAVFANRDAENALKTLLRLLDQDRDGGLTAEEKSSAHRDLRA
jgi:hypothetical protein